MIHDNALEFLENVLVPEFRGAAAAAHRQPGARQAARGAGQPDAGHGGPQPDGRGESLLSSEDPWLRSCAAYAIGTLRLPGSPDLARLAEDADPLLRETARQAQARVREA